MEMRFREENATWNKFSRYNRSKNRLVVCRGIMSVGGFYE